jgi:hypothetical protein
MHSDFKADQSNAYQDPHNVTSVESSNNNQPVRTPSQPVSELTRSSALGSHSPKPLEQLEVSNEDLNPSSRTEDPVSRHRRRNTLPSVTLSFHEAQMLAATLGEVGMRPSSKPPLHHSDGELARNLKRRSRSADELREEARSHQMSPIQWRRRSGEIQYWRNSVLENPIPRIRVVTLQKLCSFAQLCPSISLQRFSQAVPVWLVREFGWSYYHYGPKTHYPRSQIHRPRVCHCGASRLRPWQTSRVCKSAKATIRTGYLSRHQRPTLFNPIYKFWPYFLVFACRLSHAC